MGPKKSSSPNISGKENLIWTRSMDDALIDAFVNEYNCGNKVNGTFTSTAYENIVKELSALFGKNIDKEKVKNRWKTLKSKFSEVYDIFNSTGMSGFAWNSTTKLWDAEPQVWDALIEAKPKAATLRFIPFPNYEKMVLLYGNDRATGEDAETAFEMRKRRASSTENLFTTTIDEVDNLVSQNEVVLENNWDSIDVDNDIFSFFTQHGSKGANSGATSKKRKKEDAMKDKVFVFEIMKGAIDNVATALREGNELFKDMYSRKVPPISGEETWALIKECGFESNLLTDTYCFLMNDTDKLRCVVQYPSEARKDVIMRMMFDPSNPPL